MTAFREIPLEEYLSGDNPWTARLFGKDPFQQTRDSAQVEREYDRDFYGERLQRFRADPAAYRARSLFGGIHEVTGSFGDRIVRMPQAAYLGVKRASFLELLERFGGPGPLCELGAGNGQNHAWLEASQPRAVYGGEYSANAVELAGLLGFDVVRFDFYAPEDYALVRPDSTVFTMHAIEQIPDATCVLDGLRRVRDRVRGVIHFEPGWRETRTNLLGRLRNRYLEINDYNRNLLRLLEDAPDLEILHLEKDAFGNNALNPSTIVVWRFT